MADSPYMAFARGFANGQAIGSAIRGRYNQYRVDKAARKLYDLDASGKDDPEARAEALALLREGTIKLEREGRDGLGYARTALMENDPTGGTPRRRGMIEFLSGKDVVAPRAAPVDNEFDPNAHTTRMLERRERIGQAAGMPFTDENEMLAYRTKAGANLLGNMIAGINRASTGKRQFTDANGAVVTRELTDDDPLNLTEEQKDEFIGQFQALAGYNSALRGWEARDAGDHVFIGEPGGETGLSLRTVGDAKIALSKLNDLKGGAEAIPGQLDAREAAGQQLAAERLKNLNAVYPQMITAITSVLGKENAPTVANAMVDTAKAGIKYEIPDADKVATLRESLGGNLGEGDVIKAVVDVQGMPWVTVSSVAGPNGTPVLKHFDAVGNMKNASEFNAMVKEATGSDTAAQSLMILSNAQAMDTANRLNQLFGAFNTITGAIVTGSRPEFEAVPGQLQMPAPPPPPAVPARGALTPDNVDRLNREIDPDQLRTDVSPQSNGQLTPDFINSFDLGAIRPQAGIPTPQQRVAASGSYFPEDPRAVPTARGINITAEGARAANAKINAENPEWLLRRAAPYLPAIKAAAQRHGIPPQLLAAMIAQESKFDPNAVSEAGAMGLAQYLRGTADDAGIDPFDPAQSIDQAAKDISRRLKKYGTYGEAFAGHFAGDGGAGNRKVEADKYVAEMMVRTALWDRWLNGPRAGGGGGGGVAMQRAEGGFVLSPDMLEYVRAD